MLLLPPSSGRRWRIAPEVGFALISLRPTPCPSGIPLPSEGGRWATHPASPSFLWKEGEAPEVGFALFRLRPTPALRASPFHRKGVDGLLIPLLPPSSGRRWRIAPEVGFTLFRLQPTPCPSDIPLPWEGGRSAAPEVGFALFRLRPTPCPSGIPLPWEGGRFLTASPAFLRKEEINYLNSLQRSSKTSWLGFST